MIKKDFLNFKINENKQRRLNLKKIPNLSRATKNDLITFSSRFSKNIRKNAQRNELI